MTSVTEGDQSLRGTAAWLILIAVFLGGCAEVGQVFEGLRVYPSAQHACYDQATRGLRKSEDAHREALAARVKAGEISEAHARQLEVEHQARLDFARQQAWIQCQ